MSNEIRTIEIQPNRDSMIKAGELVDVIEVTPLTLTDRKIYNLFIDNAGNDIAKPIEHSIDKITLQLSRRGNERIDDSINRLMGAIAKIKTIRNGEISTLRVQLLGRNIEHDRKDGKFYYTFDPVLREVFSDSTIFARLKTDVMLSFNGKYALALYEMTAKRINMKKTSEIFSITEFRNLLNVPKGKLKTWHNFRSYAIEPAVAEVNQLATDFRVEVQGIKQGRSFVEVEMKWWRSAPDGEDSAINELTYSKTGRKSRREGTVQKISMSSKLEFSLTDQAKETARKILLKSENRMGLQYAIQRWQEAFKDQEAPKNPNGAFIAFCKKLAKT